MSVLRRRAKLAVWWTAWARRRQPHRLAPALRGAAGLLLGAALAAAGCAPLAPGSGDRAGLMVPGQRLPGPDFPFRASRGYPSLAPLLREVTPAVVNVSVVSQVALGEHPFLRDPDFRRFLERFNLEVPDPDETQQRQSIGSGLIIDGARGFVLTNAHVTEDAREITVTLKDRRSFTARLIGRDPGTDIAVLRIAPIEAPTLRFGDSEALEVGDFVLAIGNPFGLGQTVTSGIVSAVGRGGIAGNTLGALIQTDASINPGNSGGPLINLAGEVVGINTALIGPTGGNVGIGFAVPSNRVRRAMERILRGQ